MYYILNALDKVGSTKMNMFIKEYYGGMLSRGATTFWEDFDITWLENSGRIDEETPVGMRDLHKDFGRFCYKGLRHSLCHGWACGVLPYFVEKCLGLEVLEAGYKKIRVQPKLGSLKFIKAKIPTPYGIIEISIDENGCNVSAPKEVEIV